MSKKTMKGTEILIRSLEEQGVDIIFGYPGGAAIDIYDALYDSKIKHILARHEQGAGHMADGYARSTGKVGVALVTSGPGATNIVTPIATAKIDSVPLVVITGQVGRSAIGKDAFQETDALGIMTPVTKYTYQLKDAKSIPKIVQEAFHIANTGRKGPVVIDVPKNVGNEEVDLEDLETEIHLPAYKTYFPVDDAEIKAIFDLLEESKKPLIMAGGGVCYADACKELREFAHKYDIPVVSTLLGLGSMDHNDELFLGFAGMHGAYAANMAIYNADLLIGIGTRFSDRVATNPEKFAKNAKIVHIDIDNSEIDKIIKTDASVLGDAKDVLEEMLNYPLMETFSTEKWVEENHKNKKDYPQAVLEAKNYIRPQRVIEYLGEKTEGKARIVTDVGQAQMWAAQYYPFTQPYQFLSSGGLGTMGYGIPAAIGAAFADSEMDVYCIVGDGGFQMTAQELNVLKRYKEKGIHPKFILLNNSVLGMVHQWQDLFYDDRYSETEFDDYGPDFVQLSEALGVKADRVSEPGKLEKAMDKMIDFDGPYVLEVIIDPAELVLPMVPAGKNNNEMEGLD